MRWIFMGVASLVLGILLTVTLVFAQMGIGLIVAGVLMLIYGIFAFLRGLFTLGRR